MQKVLDVEVKNLQKFLKEKGFFTYNKFTNYFGSVTERALKAYQKNKGITASGMLDIATANLIKTRDANTAISR